MNHDLHANASDLKPLHLTGWTHLLEQRGTYFTCISRGARWFMLYDERMTSHHHDVDGDDIREQVTDTNYPAILCNCGGFEVTEEEAKVMARIARNYAAIQRTLEEPSEEERNQPFDAPDYLKPFPQYIRRDWVEDYEKFADWAEQSQGFKIY